MVRESSILVSSGIILFWYPFFTQNIQTHLHFWIHIHSQLSRSCTARGSNTGFSLVGPTKGAFKCDSAHPLRLRLISPTKRIKGAFQLNVKKYGTLCLTSNTILLFLFISVQIHSRVYSRRSDPKQERFVRLN